ncbi:DUF4190 domain-containing protein [Actinomycetes bacterium M1A6_2h]
MTGPTDSYPSGDPQQPYNQPGQPQYGQPQYGQPQYGQPQSGQPQYGAAPGYGQPPVSPKNGFGLAALILGILSILAFWSFGFGIVLGLLAILFGFLGRSRVKKRVATNGGVALTGIVLGIIGVIAGIAFLWIVVWAADKVGFTDYASCISDAGSNEQAIASCNDQFTNNIQDQFSVTITPLPTP